MPPNCLPQYSVHTSKYPKDDVPEIFVSYYGAQDRGDPETAAEFVSWMRSMLSHPDAPLTHDWAFVDDRSGFKNHVFILYWTDLQTRTRFENSPEFVEFWNADARLCGDVGYWRECMRFPITRIETIFVNHRAQGLARLQEVVGPIQVHGYNGSMRDRVPDSEKGHRFRPSAVGKLKRLPDLQPLGKRITVDPPDNLCIIRSGQDANGLSEKEDKLWREILLPPLTIGMDYALHHPEEIGCLNIRWITELDAEGRTFGVKSSCGIFLSVAHLEKWVSAHPTHAAMFDALPKVSEAMDHKMDLQLWHEVWVLPREGQLFEYVNCGSEVGLLPWFQGSVQKSLVGV
jgi:aldoxime dehydratase